MRRSVGGGPSVDPNEWARRMADAKARAAEIRERRKGGSSDYDPPPHSSQSTRSSSSIPLQPQVQAQSSAQPHVQRYYAEPQQDQYSSIPGSSRDNMYDNAPPPARPAYRGMVSYGGSAAAAPSATTNSASSAFPASYPQQQTYGGYDEPPPLPSNARMAVSSRSHPRDPNAGSSNDSRPMAHPAAAQEADETFHALLRGDGGDSRRGGGGGGGAGAKKRPVWNNLNDDVQPSLPLHSQAASSAEPTSPGGGPMSTRQKLAMMRGELKAPVEIPSNYSGLAQPNQQAQYQSQSNQRRPPFETDFSSSGLGAASDPYAYAPPQDTRGGGSGGGGGGGGGLGSLLVQKPAVSRTGLKATVAKKPAVEKVQAAPIHFGNDDIPVGSSGGGGGGMALPSGKGGGYNLDALGPDSLPPGAVPSTSPPPVQRRQPTTQRESGASDYGDAEDTGAVIRAKLAAKAALLQQQKASFEGGGDDIGAPPSRAMGGLSLLKAKIRTGSAGSLRGSEGSGSGTSAVRDDANGGAYYGYSKTSKSNAVASKSAPQQQHLPPQKYKRNDYEDDDEQHNYDEENEEMPIKTTTSRKGYASTSAPAPAPPPEEEEEGEQGERTPCDLCGRKFSERALEVHSRICKKVFQQKRKAFDIKSQIVPDEAREVIAKKGSSKRGAKAEAEMPKPPATKWEQKSNQLREAMKAARQYKEDIANNVDPSLRAPPPPPSAPDPSLIPCPNCGRSFGEQAAERHIPKCASIRAKPTMLKKGAGIAAGAAGAAMSGAAAVRAQMAPASRNSAPIQQPPMNTTSLRGSQQQQQQQQQQTSMSSSRVGGGGGGRIPDIPNVPAAFSGSFASNRQRGSRTATTGGASCSTSLGCWLNGDCSAGVCVCDPAWTGSSCNILAEQPAHQLWPPPDTLPSNISILPSSWGSTIVQDETGIFHIYVEVVCRFFTWMHIAGSVIVHATSQTIQGPYSFSDIALPQQSMTPHLVRDHDGAWLLLHQRNISVRGDPMCTGEEAASAFANGDVFSKSGPNSSEFDGPPSIARSLSLYGPWEPFDFVITPPPGTKIVNPNPSLLPLSPGAGYLLAFVSTPLLPPYSESVSFAYADDWRTGVFTPITGNGAPPPTTFLDCEDPFLWKSDRGMHVVCHRRASAPASNPWNFTDVGGYGVSVDGKNWTWSATPIYTTTIPWGGEAAGVEFQFGRRERPEFLLGPTGRPEYLTNGVEFVTEVLGNPSMSVMIPLGPKSPTRPLYEVTVTDKTPTPILSKGLPVGSGHSPCNLTFNPAFLPAHPPGLNKSIAIVRVSGCPASYGGPFDHLMYAECEDDGSKCSDLNNTVFPFEYLAEDPRVFFNPSDEHYYLFYFANGTNQSTVFLRRSPTPLIMDSWELLASSLPWHRNGCAFQADNGRFYVLFGETYSNAYPGKYIEGIGIAEPSDDWKTFTTLNSTLLEPANFGPEPEVCLEAATPPVQLSTGDWLFFFAAGTQGWGPWGPGLYGKYVAGWIVLDKNDPTIIVQRGLVHPFSPSTDYEIGSNPAWPVYRNNTLFVTSLVPIPGEKDAFRAWYGAADANVATAIVRVSIQQ